MECLKSYQDAEFLTPAPYEELYALREDAFAFQARYEELCKASGLGKRVFSRLYKEIAERHDRPAPLTVYQGSVTQFENQPMELDTGEWRADDGGITARTGAGEIIACAHPILPVCRLVNVDSGLEKLELAFRKGVRWRRVIADKRTLASANSIVSLADHGISVTSENARHLVKYLSDLENYNYDLIPEKPSVGRLGYIEGEGFSPFVEGLTFDGDANFRTIFNSVHPAGKREIWAETIHRIREGNVAAKIVVAASFASALVHPIGALPFFVHLWGAESGTGKTVALMAAASVWADPQVGRYIQTFNSTNVGHERLAGFLNSLPVIVDELQLARDAKGKINFDVYRLAEGVGKTRGTRTGGMDLTPTWSNCIITSGETPITAENAGAGARNRVLEIECTAEKKVIQDGHQVSAALKRNFGFAGREFVEALQDPENLEQARMIYKTCFECLSASDTTEKQAMAASIVIAADHIACMTGILKDAPLQLEEVRDFLRTNREVDVNARAYDWLRGWLAENAGMFQESRWGDGPNSNTWGKISQDRAWILRSVFNREVTEAGFSPQALLSWMKRRGKILTRKNSRAFTVNKSINGIDSECVAMILSDTNP